MKKKIYISGQISGRDYSDVMHEFLNKEVELEEQGYEVLNPLNNGLLPCHSYNEHMVRDIEMLFQADEVYMLSNWHLSKGARVEHFIANTYGKAIFYEQSN